MYANDPIKTNTIIVENSTYIIFVFVIEFCVSENNHEDNDIIKNTSAFSIPVLITSESGLLRRGLINSET
jgi:hypothetical protein